MPTHHETMATPDQILQKALEKEKQARDFYAGLAADCTVLFVRELLEKLENEEAKHVIMVQNMLGRLQAGVDMVR